MRKSKLEEYVVITGLSAVLYLLLDLPVRLTGFLDFGAYIGIKNLLPAVLGLFFGWYGAAGCVIGCTLTSLITDAAFSELLYENISIVVFGLGLWILWHAGAKSHRVHLKKFGDYMKYILLTALLSAVCGLLGDLMLGKGIFLSVFTAYFSMSLLVGIPTIILLSSVMCMIPILPPRCYMKPDVSGMVNSDPGTLDALNDMLDEYAAENHINRKSLYGIQNCIEEIMIRIHTFRPDTGVSITFYYDDSASLWFEYTCKKYNPFIMEKGEATDEMFGLLLIKHRALRVSHQCRNDINRIHIVI
ncbi:MAG: hypothetical protein Q4G60_04615 [bacterium]|nr:hypothetical protein [bacterium]